MVGSVKEHPPMRNILEIDEILRTFMRFCDKSTLARLARTSKVFSDPVLDVLWEHLESFAHLLKVFSPELISWQPSDTAGQPKPAVNHLIVPRDWNRFTLYAQRIRSWGPEDLSYIDEPVVDHIAFGRPPGYILPRLTHMEVTATNVSGLHLQILILCPSIESVSVRNPEPNSGVTRTMYTFFRTLADRVPKFSKLVLHWGNGRAVTEQFVEGLSDVFSRELSELESVNLWTPDCLDAAGFSGLANLPNLATVHLNLTGTTQQFYSNIRDTSTTFRSLQNLFLAGEMEGFNRLLLCFNDAPSMASLGFSVREYPKSQELQELFKAVSSKFSSLRRLQFNVPKQEINIQVANRLYFASPELYHYDISVLQPLLSMHRLAAVHLELGIPLYLTDMDLFALGTAWPTIEALNLCSDPYCERARAVRPTSTIIGLLALTEACPYLKHLGLVLDFSTGITEMMIAGANVASRVLLNLDVGRSRVLDPSPVAALLSGVFPEMKVFQWAGMDGSDELDEVVEGAGILDEYAPGWRQVDDLLPVFRAVRANERRLRSVGDSLEDSKMLMAVG